MLGRNYKTATIRKALAIGAVVGTLCVASASKAALVLSLTDVDASQTVDPTTPGSTANFTYSDFVASSTNSVADGVLSLKSGEITNNDPSASHTVTVKIEQDGYTLPGAPGSTLSLFGSYGGTFEPAGTIIGSMSAFADIANNQDASAAPTVVGTSGTQSFSGPPDLGFQGFTSPQMFTRSSVGTGAYSLAGIVSLTIPSGVTVDFSTKEITFSLSSVPEPTSLGLGALSGLLLLRRRRAKI